MWNADEALAGEMMELLSLASDRGDDPDLSAEDFLVALGTLVFMEREDDVRVALGLHGLALAGMAERFVAQDLSGRIDETLAVFLQAVAELEHADLEDSIDAEQGVMDALESRERIALADIAASRILGSTARYRPETEGALDAFDQLVRQELWRTVPLGGRRAARCAWAAPAYRGQLWWWSIGADLPSTALRDLQITARLLAAFPEARLELDRCLEGEICLKELLGRGEPRMDQCERLQQDVFVPLGEALRRNCAASIHIEPVGHFPWRVEISSALDRLVATAAPTEQIIAKLHGLGTLRADIRDLIVDLDIPLQQGCTPQLETAGLDAVAGREDPDISDRFLFALTEEVFTRRSVVLMIPAVDEEIRVRIVLQDLP